METCFISKKRIISLPGEVGKMDPYVLEFKDPEDDRTMQEGAVGICYAKYLAASKWANFWGNRQRAHFVRNLGLKLIAEIDGMTLWLNSNREAFILLFPYGVSLQIPSNSSLEEGELYEGMRYAVRKREMNLHDLPSGIADEVKKTLEKDGEYDLLTLAERLDVVDCFLNPKVLEGSKLLYDEELSNYWMGNSISVMCTYRVAIPEAVLAAVKKSRR